MNKTNYLLKDGRIGIRVKKHLREFLNQKNNRNDFLNDLIEKEYKATHQTHPAKQ